MILRNQSAERGAPTLCFQRGRDSITQKSEAAYLAGTPAYCSGMPVHKKPLLARSACLQGTSLTECHWVYKEEPQSGESEAPRGSEGRDCFQREQNVTKKWMGMFSFFLKYKWCMSMLHPSVVCITTQIQICFISIVILKVKDHWLSSYTIHNTTAYPQYYMHHTTYTIVFI